jgi:hypothetical protein
MRILEMFTRWCTLSVQQQAVASASNQCTERQLWLREVRGLVGGLVEQRLHQLRSFCRPQCESGLLIDRFTGLHRYAMRGLDCGRAREVGRAAFGRTCQGRFSPCSFVRPSVNWEPSLPSTYAIIGTLGGRGGTGVLERAGGHTHHPRRRAQFPAA